jgi:hypothetical protein
MIRAGALILVETGANLLDHKILETRRGIKQALHTTLNLRPSGLIEVAASTLCEADGIFVPL